MRGWLFSTVKSTATSVRPATKVIRAVKSSTGCAAASRMLPVTRTTAQSGPARSITAAVTRGVRSGDPSGTMLRVPAGS